MAGWVRNKLGAITTKIGSGATPLGGEEAYKESGIALIRSLNVHDWGFKETKLAYIDEVQAARLSNVVVKANDVLLNITGASVARCCLVPSDILPARVSQHVSIIRPITSIISPPFLRYLLTSKTYKNRLLHTGEGGGSTRQAITKAQIQDFPIEYPETLAEQERIVAFLDEAFDGIVTAKANAEKNLQNARALFESHLIATFSQREAEWGHAVPLSSVLSVQPRNGWSPPAEYQTGEGVPVLTLSSVTGFKYDGTRVKLSSAPTRDRAHYWLQEGELLITRSNTKELVGHVAIFDGTPQRAICCDLIMKMQVNPAVAHSRFIYFYLRSPEARSYLTSRAQGASSTMKKIGKGVVQSIPIPLPSIPQQMLSTAKLDAIETETQRLESIYQQKLAALDELKESLLSKAFTRTL
jgi:type I restriction enzyme S subunit